MPKFRMRASGTKSRVRIPKGMSSESNPQRNKHRAAANAARIASVQQQGMVAVDDREMLPAGSSSVLPGDDAIVDQLCLETMSIGKGPSSAKSMVSEGGLSALSAFTTCTNPNFDAVHRLWKSGSSMQTEVVAVLAAVAEIIKEKGGAESDVEYMAALLITLEGIPRGEPTRVAATAYLLHLVIRKVPKEVLQANFSQFVNIIYTKLLEYMEAEESSILKHLLAGLGVILKAQPPSVWASSQTKNILVSVCALCTHERPWVRTMARRVTRAVLTDPVTALDNGLHAAASPVASYVLKQLQGSLTSKSGVVQATRYLCLLEGIMHKVPATLFKQLAETILRSFSIADPTVKCSAMQCLQRALERQPCDAALTAETSSLLVESLRSLAPPMADITVLAHWMQALAEAQICLSTKDQTESLRIIGDTLACFVKLFDCANEQLAQLTYQLLSRLIDYAMQEEEETAKSLLGLLHNALHVQSAPVWRFVVRTQMKLFERGGAALIGQQLADTLRSLAEMRQVDSCQCKADIDFTIGAAIRYVGAGAVLSVIGLQLDPDAAVLPLDLPRSWMIPVLRVNLHNAPLSLFLKYFLPLAIKLHRRLPTLDPLVARLYSTLQLQLWDLLPQFLDSPSDFETTFPTLAPILGTAIQERKDLRMVVLSSLRAALKFTQQPDAPAERVSTMSRFAKNFQPLLFNLYTAGVEDEYVDRNPRLSALETIRMYAELTPREFVTKYVESALAKIVETEGDAVKQAKILDVIAALVRNTEPEMTEVVLLRVLPWSAKQPKKHDHLQKKSYRVIEEILKRKGNAELDPFFAQYGPQLVEAVTRPVSEVVSQARAAQMGAARLVLSTCTELQELKQFSIPLVKNIVPMLDKTNSTAARSSASKALQELCSKVVAMGIENGEGAAEVLGPVIGYIYEQTQPIAGKVGDIPQGTAQGALVALNIIAQKQLKQLSSSHTSQLISHASTWMADKRPAVRVLAIRLLRVLIQKMSDFLVAQFREVILSSYFAQNPSETTVKIRKANRLLLSMLMERMGTPIVQKAAIGKEEEWTRLIRSIEKQRRRRERLAANAPTNGEAHESDDDAMSVATSRTSARTAGADTILALLEDSGDEDEDKDSETKSRVSRRGSVWLKEDDETTPIDLLDRSHMVNKISTTDPEAISRKKAKDAKRREASGGFKINKDGKLVIDLDLEDDTRWKRKKRKEEEEDEMPEKRRRVEPDSDDSGDEGERATTASGWKPGGKGIHRDTTKSVVSGVSGVSRVSAATSRGGESRKNGKKDKNGKKPGKPVQPYAYVPLKNMRKGGKGKQELKSLLGRKRKAPGGRGSKAAVGL